MTGPVPTSPGRRSLAVLLAVLGVLGLTWAWAVRVLVSRPGPPEVSRPGRPEREPDVIFVPTPQEVVDRMLELAEVKKGDVLYDLGCGDGRIVVTAAKKYGVKAVGFDIDPQRIRESRENVRKSGVEDLVTIKQADIFAQDLREASVVTLYLLPHLNVRLMPQLARLRPGSRIVSHAFDMKGAKPQKVERLPTSSGAEATIYLWVVPWEEDGAEDPGPPPATPDGAGSGGDLPRPRARRAASPGRGSLRPRVAGSPRRPQPRPGDLPHPAHLVRGVATAVGPAPASRRGRARVPLAPGRIGPRPPPGPVRRPARGLPPVHRRAGCVAVGRGGGRPRAGHGGSRETPAAHPSAGTRGGPPATGSGIEPDVRDGA